MKKVWIVACLAVMCAAGCGQTAEKQVESLVVNETWIVEEVPGGKTAETPAVKVEEETEDQKAGESGILEEDTKEMETIEIKGDLYFLVMDEADLRAVGTAKYGLDQKYMLQADISMSQEWIPVGTKENPFTGVFNGNGYTIEGLRIPEGEAAGLFGYAKGAKIYNVTLQDAQAKTVDGSAGPLTAVCGMQEECEIFDNEILP